MSRPPPLASRNTYQHTALVPHSTCVISIIRIQTLRVAAETQDPTYDNAPAACWSFLELTIGVIAACLPTLRPLFVKLMPKLLGVTSASYLSGGTERPSRAAYPHGSRGCALSNKNGGSSGVGGWSRAGGKGSTLSSPATLNGASDSAEELHANIGGMGRRDGRGNGSDVEYMYGLQDLGRLGAGDVQRSDYRVVVSGGDRRVTGGASGNGADARRGLPKIEGGRGGPHVGWGIKATTMITQQVDIGGKRKPET